MIRSSLIIILLFIVCSCTLAQYTISGKITSGDKAAPLAGATIHLKNTGNSTLSRADGSFAIRAASLPDSLQVSSIGFATTTMLLESRHTENIVVTMRSTTNQLQAVVVGSSKNKANTFMEKVLANKDNNSPSQLSSYQYQRYTKNELDIGNLDFEKKRNRIFDTILNLYKKVDGNAQGRKEAAVYFDERIINVYHSQAPRYDGENTVAKKSLGLESDVLLSKLTKFYLHFNVYDDWLPIFDQTYASPLAKNAFSFYHFYEGDSTKESGETIQQVHFVPSHPYERTFTGDLWINKRTFAVTAVSMHLSRTADLNFVRDIHYNEEYKQTEDSLSGKSRYMPYRYSSETEFESGLDLIGIPVKKREKASVFLFRSATDVSGLLLNSPAAAMISGAEKEKTTNWSKPDSYWQNARTEPLTAHEKNIYLVVDSLKNNRMIIRSMKLVSFATTGYWNIGNKVGLGPYSLFLSRNPVEGWRIRPGFLTMTGFNQKLNLYGYAAYGTKDRKIKGAVGARYIWNAARWTRTSITYSSDYDLAVDQDEELDKDNLINSFLRKPVPYFRAYVSQFQVKHEQYLSPSWGISGSLAYKEITPVFTFKYHPIDPVTDKPHALIYSSRLPVAQATIGLRYARNEKTRVYNYDLIHIRTFSPVLTANYTWGVEFGKAQFPFHKVDVAVEQFLRLPPKSLLYYKVSGGQVFGTLPYLLLDVPQGNEFYVASKHHFNTMLPYEFAADRYVSFHARLSLGGALLSKIPLLKELGWRERISFNSFWGDMTNANLTYNSESGFRTASRVPFMEGSIGIENIFHLLSIEYYKRLTYTSSRAFAAGGIFLGITLNF